MRHRGLVGIAALVLTVAAAPAAAQPVQGGVLPGPFPLFPPTNWWNVDISGAPVDPNSPNLIAFIGGATQLHPDFGGEITPGSTEIYGFPYIVVDGTQAKKTVQFDFSDESDGVDHNTDTSFPFYPIPSQAETQDHWIEEGFPGNVDRRSVSDRHILIVDRDNKHLYELYNVWCDPSTVPCQWFAGSGAFFDMNTNNRRPETWTSADAAGLAILPGLVRRDEVFGANPIRHAFRVTVQRSNGHVFPASHTAGSTAGALPMGARLRLKASTDISSYTPEMQRIFQAMKTYGLIVADNGTNMYVSGTFDTQWDNDVLNPAFHSLHASDFEVVQLGFVPPSLGLSVNDASVTEGNAGTTTATFTVTLSAVSGSAVTVDFATANGTATVADGDYGATSGTLTFAAGETSKTITVDVNGDTKFEANETFFVNLSNAMGATITDGQGQGTINNDDAMPSISINDVAVTEGNAGTTPATFMVTLSAVSGVTTTVNYATSDGTAAGGSDYVAIGSTVLTFNPGETVKTITVNVIGDTALEPDEIFFVNLSGATNATIADNQGQGTITNDDSPPTISINDVTVLAGSVGTSNANFTVSLSSASFQTITVNYATSDSTATAGSDYVAVASTVLTFNPFETSKTVAVVVNPNPTFEPDETFFVDLSGATNATIADNQGQATIIDDTQPAGDGKALDYTANMKADLAWRNRSTGQVYLWPMNGATPTAFSPVATISDLNWRIVGQGDFNADGKADLVWYNVSTGQVYIWFMNGATPISYNPVTTVGDLNWRIVATADFNGDGKADLCWHNRSTGQVYIWLMNGASIVASGLVATVADLNWRIVAARDFTGDGKADLVWYNRSTGAVYLWPMNGLTATAFSSVATISDLDWRIVASGDYNGDGKSDLVWHHRSTGQVYTWFMNGATPTSFSPVGTVADLNWGIVAAGDFDADGKTDLVWYNRSTGQVYLWLMNGATPSAISPVATISDLNWGIVRTE
jgi:hypothetical protein